jgi:cytochrome P450
MITACWALLFLGKHSDWRRRAVSEVQSLISSHCGVIASTESFYKQLASVPFSAWEDELPSLDLIIRETIRLSTSFIFLRRNLKTDLDSDGAPIAKGDYVAYLSADVHMNENAYPSPGTFDPGRYEDGRNEDTSVHCGYVGWGAGKKKLFPPKS